MMTSDEKNRVIDAMTERICQLVLTDARSVALRSVQECGGFDEIFASARSNDLRVHFIVDFTINELITFAGKLKSVEAKQTPNLNLDLGTKECYA